MVSSFSIWTTYRSHSTCNAFEAYRSCRSSRRCVAGANCSRFDRYDAHYARKAGVFLVVSPSSFICPVGLLWICYAMEVPLMQYFVAMRFCWSGHLGNQVLRQLVIGCCSDPALEIPKHGTELGCTPNCSALVMPAVMGLWASKDRVFGLTQGSLVLHSDWKACFNSDLMVGQGSVIDLTLNWVVGLDSVLVVRTSFGMSVGIHRIGEWDSQIAPQLSPALPLLLLLPMCFPFDTLVAQLGITLANASPHHPCDYLTISFTFKNGMPLWWNKNRK